MIHENGVPAGLLRKMFAASRTAVWGLSVLTLVFGMSLALAGCGGDEDGGDNPPTGKTLASIAITTQPTKTTYIVGESLDTADMVVTATYSDNSTAAVTDYTPTGFDSSAAAASQTITVSYTEGGVTKTATFSITVKAPTVPADLIGTWNNSDGTITFTSTGYTRSMQLTTNKDVASYAAATNSTTGNQNEYPTGYRLTLSDNTNIFCFLNTGKTAFAWGTTFNNATVIYTK